VDTLGLATYIAVPRKPVDLQWREGYLGHSQHLDLVHSLLLAWGDEEWGGGYWAGRHSGMCFCVVPSPSGKGLELLRTCEAMWET
jgi:hypothetical protein